MALSTGFAARDRKGVYRRHMRRRGRRTFGAGSKRDIYAAPVPYRKKASKGADGNEMKYLDTSFDVADILTTGNVLSSMNIIPQGEKASERIGHKAVVMSLSWRYTLEMITPVLLNGVSVRLVVVQDRQSNGTVPAFSDIFDDNKIGSQLYTAYQKMSNELRFNVMYDKIHDVNSLTRDFDAPLVESAYYSKKRLGIVINWDSSTTGVVAEMTTNNIIAYAVSNRNGVCLLASEFRIRYYD